MALVKKVVIIMLSISLQWFLLGQKEVKVSGNLIIPGAIEGHPYKFKTTVIITLDQITIECDKKIFQLFNRFFSPRSQTLSFATSELKEMKVDKKDYLIIIPQKDLHQKYRNLFHPIREVLSYIPWNHTEIEQPGLIIELDNVDSLTEMLKTFLEDINKKINQTDTGKPRIFSWENGAKIYQD